MYTLLKKGNCSALSFQTHTYRHTHTFLFFPLLFCSFFFNIETNQHPRPTDRPHHGRTTDGTGRGPGRVHAAAAERGG